MMSAKETTERQKNLQRWSELEPERATVKPLGYVSISRDDGRTDDLWNDGRRSGEANDALLGTLIEAITARGWTAKLFCEPLGNRAELATYRLSVFDEPRATGATPTDALLAAYIQAIEAAK